MKEGGDRSKPPIQLTERPESRLVCDPDTMLKRGRLQFDSFRPLNSRPVSHRNRLVVLAAVAAAVASVVSCLSLQADLVLGVWEAQRKIASSRCLILTWIVLTFLFLVLRVSDDGQLQQHQKAWNMQISEKNWTTISFSSLWGLLSCCAL
jgi:hypothetical protein